MAYDLSIDTLVGKTFIDVKNINDESILLRVSDTEAYLLYHSQDCCESVYVEEIHGDLNDLIGTPIIVAEERTEGNGDGDYGDVVEWTFYTFRTIKGDVTIRFYGSSNGYYSTSVYLRRFN